MLAHGVLFGMASVLLITGGDPYAVDGHLERVATDADEHVETLATSTE
ncbi:DoxX family protein [Natronorubrum tibetense GA33]|uniref:DoxX family protein n=1 Tax=Natronorubrum tibetense GA33 TaxID=1114856 RepID=L9W7U5_9EURY|nr:DoxX family protein [Natronorubrum tibetense GA33]